MPAISYGVTLYRGTESRVVYDALHAAIARADGWTDQPTPEPTPEPTAKKPGRPKKGRA